MAMKDEIAGRAIVQHPDVRRMLLKMKSISEGIRLVFLLLYLHGL